MGLGGVLVCGARGAFCCIFNEVGVAFQLLFSGAGSISRGWWFGILEWYLMRLCSGLNVSLRFGGGLGVEWCFDLRFGEWVVGLG